MKDEAIREQSKKDMRKNLLIIAGGIAVYYYLIIHLPSKA